MNDSDRSNKAVSFAVVRRGFDAAQVTEHLARVEAEVAIVLADRAAAVEQVGLLTDRLDTAHSELDAARGEIERMRHDIQVLSGSADTVARMDERLQVVQRLARVEFTERQTAAAAEVARIIAGVGGDAEPDVASGRPLDADGPGAAGFDVEHELHRRHQEAIEERSRLDQVAAAERAKVDEDFRTMLELRCREALAQVTSLHSDAVATARRMLDDADQQVKARLGEVDESTRRMVDAARREAEDLRELQRRLAQQLGASRNLISQAIPEAAPSGAGEQQPDPDPTDVPQAEPEVPAPSPVPTAERAMSTAVWAAPEILNGRHHGNEQHGNEHYSNDVR